ncbi:LysR substrate-binding domain-containing protein [Amphritea sp. 2_MG-2023]|jgi:LysR family glycine cleavage system transcriptional activator|uniref:LysR substrate-binding domain-containing protein n=1 Tax=Amphritea TaxID=515417 RepID=UPI001C0709D2|nr:MULTISPECIES: LysR substrate-binding domain-containing protein [Amphritea]MBU2966584.1 LysR family transcriptional regulator [Amphritea atlantica]MDO6417557.1 LysR substrate-binding domain-containing protein [Amphritea sp. 2_MG-2023]
MKRYPSTTALRAFEAISRLGSVSAAAEELNLTRSAVSHQLNVLEDVVGFALTQKEGRGLTLTRKGESYALEVKKALTILLEASRVRDEEEMVGKLTISCAPGLANYWLSRKLSGFIKKYPKLSLHILTPSFPGDISNNDVDLFITYGNGSWSGKYVKQLITIQLFPVCSPHFFHKQGGLGHPSNLVKMPLFHLMNHTDWRVWLAANGVSHTELEGGVVFSDANLVQSAAIAGQGIAIGDNMVSGDALEKGLLIRPFEKSIESPRAYYLVTSPKNVERNDVAAFIDWLEGLISDAQSRYDRPNRGAL